MQNATVKKHSKKNALPGSTSIFFRIGAPIQNLQCTAKRPHRPHIGAYCPHRPDTGHTGPHTMHGRAPATIARARPHRPQWRTLGALAFARPHNGRTDTRAHQTRTGAPIQ